MQMQHMYWQLLQKIAPYQLLDFAEKVCGLLRHNRQMPHTCKYQQHDLRERLALQRTSDNFAQPASFHKQGCCLNWRMLFVGQSSRQ